MDKIEHKVNIVDICSFQLFFQVFTLFYERMHVYDVLDGGISIKLKAITSSSKQLASWLSCVPMFSVFLRFHKLKGQNVVISLHQSFKT